MTAYCKDEKNYKLSHEVPIRIILLIFFIKSKRGLFEGLINVRESLDKKISPGEAPGDIQMISKVSIYLSYSRSYGVFG